MQIQDCYKLLNVTANSTDEEISSSFKKLALHYHPDRNRDNIAWANEVMAKLNHAYTTIKVHRFENQNSTNNKPEPAPQSQYTYQQKPRDQHVEPDPDLLTEQFVTIREELKDHLYRFFQYNLFNFHEREKGSRQKVFNDIVSHLRKTFHLINNLTKKTHDEEFIQHFNVFNDMIFNFYKASECINVIDSYKDMHEVEAFRSYKNGDDFLQAAQKEIFYDRHNRGYFKHNITDHNLKKAGLAFRETLKLFPDSSWAVESRIKRDYATALKNYLDLFFTKDD